MSVCDICNKEVNRLCLKTPKTSDEYGINYNEIINHLGECPGNRKEYHIDHIKPISMFDFTKIEEIQKAFAPDNHQWLLAKENLKKGNKYNEEL